MHAVSIMLGVPILVFQSCDNLAGYICIDIAYAAREEKADFSKIICLTKNDTSFDMLVVQDSKEIEFNKRTIEILRHTFHYEIGTYNDIKVLIIFLK